MAVATLPNALWKYRNKRRQDANEEVEIYRLQNSRTLPDRPWGPPSLLHNGYRVTPGGKTAGAWR